MSERADLAVLGAGPAGIVAAITAAGHGLDVVLIDEQPNAGGQVYRAKPAEFALGPGADPGPDHAHGEKLRAELAASRVRVHYGCRVWSVTSGWRIDAMSPTGPRTWSAPAIVAAPGTSERVVAFPGWTTPGVIGLAAATVLLKSQMVLPGERTVVAGCGPLLLAVAAGILKAGGQVAALVDLASPTEWLRRMPALASRPDLAWRGAAWLKTIVAARTPILTRHTVIEAVGGDKLHEVVVAPVEGDGRVIAGARRRFAADALAIGHGLTPATELPRLLRAACRFDAAQGGWIPVRDGDLRTTAPGLYVAGDGGGVAGAAAAEQQGRLAGLAAARDLGRLTQDAFAAKAAKLRRALSKAERFGRAMAALMAIRPGLVESIAPETPICRCEDVTRAEVESAMNDGANDVNQVKQWTRCGMGPCQGRMCGETLATLVAAHVGGRERAGVWTARAPLRPVDMDALLGDFAYADIPILKPAPI
jgi:NADPH-dependent 2,4-dienoyl-CoA reductase/sulfur reductase-like enzyme